MENKVFYFRNNSEKSWIDYNVGGGVFVSINPKSTFSVPARAAVVIRKNLCDTPEEGGKAKWIEEITKEQLPKDEVVEKVSKTDEKEVEKIKVEKAKREKKRKKK